jgi:mRNA-decapping enzyme subunit 2
MAIPQHVMDDLLFRFLHNLPDGEKTNRVRVMFQIEQAHWFYIDFYCAPEREACDGNLCKRLGFKDFVRQIFAHCDYLSKWRKNVEAVRFFVFV